jgi:3-polyprenyl-4-hydroxybenzoate decarboxylase
MKNPSYPDLHAHIAALERHGLLIRVQRASNKDTEMHPLVRWQFRGGIPEADRKAFLFENVTDSTGRKYDIPVAVGILASNREIYSLGLGSTSRARGSTRCRFRFRLRASTMRPTRRARCSSPRTPIPAARTSAITGPW